MLDGSYWFECACSCESHTIKFCACSCESHTIKFVLDEGKHFNEMPMLFLNTNLINNISWYKRIWLAVRYIFGFRSKYGHYDETIIQYEDVPKIIEILNIFKNRYEEWKS